MIKKLTNEELFAKRMKNVCKELNEIIFDARKIWPRAQIYVEDCGNIHLMSGDDHDGIKCKARHDRVITIDLVQHMGGGAW